MFFLHFFIDNSKSKMIQELHQALLPDLLSIVSDYISFPLNIRGVLKYKSPDINTFKMKLFKYFVILQEIKQQVDMSYIYLFKKLTYSQELTGLTLINPLNISDNWWDLHYFHENQWSHENMCFTNNIGEILYFSNCNFIPR